MYPQIPGSSPQGQEAWRQIAERLNRNITVTQPFHIRGVTSDVTVNGDYGFYMCDASGGAITVTLPEAGAYKSVRFFIKKIDSSANAVTIDGYSAETIDGSATAVIAVPNMCLTVVSDGTQWWIV